MIWFILHGGGTIGGHFLVFSKNLA
jgi:hypothetical protein